MYELEQMLGNKRKNARKERFTLNGEASCAIHELLVIDNDFYLVYNQSIIILRKE